MLLLPAHIVALLAPCASLFSRPVWRHVHVLLVRAILTPGRRNVSSVRQHGGLSHQPTLQAHQRVLNSAVWSSQCASRLVLGLLVNTFVPIGRLVVGIDETIERRRGRKLAAAGIYGDPVRSHVAT